MPSSPSMMRSDPRPTVDVVIARAAVEALVVAKALLDDPVVAGPAEDRVITVAAVERVVAVAPVERVVARPTVGAVCTGATGEPVVAGAAGEKVVAVATVDHVAGGATRQPVVTRPAVDDVASAGAAQVVIARQSLDPVRSAGPGQRVRAFGAGQQRKARLLDDSHGGAARQLDHVQAPTAGRADDRDRRPRSISHVHTRRIQTPRRGARPLAACKPPHAPGHQVDDRAARGAAARADRQPCVTGRERHRAGGPRRQRDPRALGHPPATRRYEPYKASRHHPGAPRAVDRGAHRARYAHGTRNARLVERDDRDTPAAEHDRGPARSAPRRQLLPRCAKRDRV